MRATFFDVIIFQSNIIFHSDVKYQTNLLEETMKTRSGIGKLKSMYLERRRIESLQQAFTRLEREVRWIRRYLDVKPLSLSFPLHRLTVLFQIKGT